MIILFKIAITIIILILVYVHYLEDIKNLKEEVFYGRKKDNISHVQTNKTSLKIDSSGRVKVIEKEMVESTLDFIDEDIEKSSIRFKHLIIFFFSTSIFWIIIDMFEYLFNLTKG